MCSIAGFISKKPLDGYTAERLTTALLYHGSDRGEQSSGVYIEDTLLKAAVSPLEFIQKVEFSKLFDRDVSRALIHTRHPTSGGHGDEQAQPFVVARDTVSVHNGWFINIHELKRKWNIQKSSGVDSELATQFIHSYGVRKLPRFISTSYGTSALGILYRDQMYLMRSGNPTAFTYLDLEDGNSLFIFASTPKILMDSLRYCWLIPSSHPIRETKDGILYHVTMKELKQISKKVNSRHSFVWTGEDEGHIFNGHRFIPQTDVTSRDPYYEPRKIELDNSLDKENVDLDSLSDEDWKKEMKRLTD